MRRFIRRLQDPGSKSCKYARVYRTHIQAIEGGNSSFSFYPLWGDFGAVRGGRESSQQAGKTERGANCSWRRRSCNVWSSARWAIFLFSVPLDYIAFSISIVTFCRICCWLLPRHARLFRRNSCLLRRPRGERPHARGREEQVLSDGTSWMRPTSADWSHRKGTQFINLYTFYYLPSHFLYDLRFYFQNLFKRV